MFAELGGAGLKPLSDSNRVGTGARNPLHVQLQVTLFGHLLDVFSF